MQRQSGGPDVGSTSRADFGIAGLAAATSIAAAVAIGGGTSPLRVLPLVLLVGLAVAMLALEKFEWFVIAALASRASLDATKTGGSPIGLDPSQLLGLLFIGCAVVWLIGRKRDGLWQPLWSSTRCALAFVGATALSLLGAARLEAGVTETSRILAAVLMLVVLNQLAGTPGALRRYLTVLLAASALPLLVGLQQLLTRGSLRAIGSFERVRSTFLHPNPFAMFCGIVLIVSVAIIRQVHGRARLAVGVIMLAAAANLVFTYTRGAWIATAVGLVIVSALLDRRIIVGIALAMAASYVFIPSVADRVRETSDTEQVGVNANNSLSWRLLYWQESLQLAKENPITGIGIKGVSESTPAEKQPHNDFIRTYVETGWIGLLAFVGFLGSALHEMREATRRARPGLPRAMSAAAFGVIAAVVVMALSANLISQVVILWYVALVIALGNTARLTRPVVIPATVATSR